ncbi:MAG: T9SS type A sorting domain-containing protein [bacterium]|nr:T9SS type A sorting domain-containing protein [bacterium]
MKSNILIILFFLAFGSNAQHNTYYIGHSGFGWDLIVGEMVNDLAADAGHLSYDYNYQFIGGTCLSTQWNNHATPQGGTDSWEELPNGYDVVVLAEQIPIQEVIYGHPWGCELRSVESTDNFYDLAKSGNPDARIYLMEFHNEVDLTLPDPFAAWSQMNQSMRPLWEQVADSVGLINNGQVCLVPVAEAFEAYADSIIAGTVQGINDWTEIFDPTDTIVATIHPTEQTYYLVACVHYATIFGESPVGLTHETIAAAGWAFDPPTPEQAAIMQNIAWEVVSNDPYSCVSTLDVIESTPKIRFRMYPNPTSGKVIMELPKNVDRILISDLHGKLIMEPNLASQELQINLTSGVYHVQVFTEKEFISQRLIVR